MRPLLETIIESNDGNYYAFTAMTPLPWKMIRAGKPYNLFVIDKKTNKVKVLTDYDYGKLGHITPFYHIYNQYFSPDGKKIIYHIITEAGTSIVQINIETGESSVLYHEESEGISRLTSLLLNDSVILINREPSNTKDVPSILLYDIENKAIIGSLYSLAEKKASFWIKDYSRDRHAVLCCQFLNIENSFLMLFSLKIIIFSKDFRSFEAISIDMPENYFATNAVLSKKGECCIYAIRDSKNPIENDEILFFDIDSHKSITIFSNKNNKNQEGRENIGMAGFWNNGPEGLYLSHDDHLFIRFGNKYRMYQLKITS